MRIKYTENAGRKAGSAVLATLGIGSGIWLSLILADVLTFVYFYWSSTNALQSYGMVEYGAKFTAVLFAAIVAYLANSMLWNMIKRNNKKWVPVLAGTMALWFVIMFVVASPYAGSLFNPFSGKAQAKYYTTSDGVIVKMPMGAKTGPEGQKLEIFDPATAVEYEQQQDRQQSKLKTPGLLGKVDQLLGTDLASDPEGQLYMEIEKIDIQPDKTVLHFAVRRVNNFLLGRFYRPHGWNYLSDERGQTYDLQRDNAIYVDWVDAETHKTRLSSGKHAGTKAIRPDEVYRFTGEYMPLNPDARQLRLHDSRFALVDLDYQLSLAQAQVKNQSSVVTVSNIPLVAASSRRGASGSLEIWVERIQVATDRTIIHLACKRKDQAYYGSELLPRSGMQAYVVDGSGQLYEVIINSPDTTIESEPLTIREGEVYRFTLAFTPLSQGASGLRLHLDSFEPALELDSAFTQAEKIPPLTQSVNQVEVVSEALVVVTEPTEVSRTQTTSDTPQPVREVSRLSSRDQTRYFPLTLPPAVAFSRPRPAPASPPKALVNPTVCQLLGPLDSTLGSEWMTSTLQGRPELLVDRIEVEKGEIQVYMCARSHRSLPVHKLSDSEMFETYLADDKGRIYEFRTGSSMFRVKDDRVSVEPYLPYADSFFLLVPGELYVFRMNFKGLEDDVDELTFHRRDYSPMKLDRQLKDLRSSLR